MSSTTARYAIGDLAGLVGSTARTIRYYVAQGLLPPPVGAGPGAHYTDAHLERLRLIQRLQRAHLPLSEIRQRLAQLGAREVSELVADTENEAPPDSALEYVRTVLAGPAVPAAAPSIGRPAQPAPPTPSAPPTAMPVAMPSAGLLRRRSAGPASLASLAMPRMRDVEALPPAARLAEAAQAFAPSSAPTEVPPADAAAASIEVEPDLQTPEQRSQWDRIGLTPNIEIHVRRPLGRLENRRVERLITIARHMLREEQP